MQDRSPIKCRQRRIRKRIVFAVAFMGFSVLFYQSALTFKQDRIASATVTAPFPETFTQSASQKGVASLALADSISPPPLQGPAAAGLAFRINSSPDLRAMVARLQRDHTGETAVYAASRPLPAIVEARAGRGFSGSRGNIR